MPESKTSNPKVLVVDDEKKFLHLAKKNLNLRGFEVEVAEAGEESIAKIYNFDPKVVLLDVLMPRLTGSDDTISLTPPRRMSLEQMLGYLNHDELAEITPVSIRLRKKLLDENERKRDAKKQNVS